MNMILARLSEPSTYAGFAALALGVGVSAPMYQAASMILAGIAGVLAIVLKEKTL